MAVDERLHDAVLKRNVAQVRRLLAEGAPVNQRFIGGRTPLRDNIHSKHRNREILQLLLANGADPNIRDGAGWTALDSALHFGWVDVVAALRGRGAECGREINCALLQSDADALTRILDANPSAEHNSIYHPAQLLKPAALLGRDDIVELLISRGLTPPLQERALEARRRAASMRLPAAGGESAAAAEAMGVAEFLALGRDLRWRGFDGETVLHVAARSGSGELVAFLIREGADVDAFDKEAPNEAPADSKAS